MTILNILGRLWVGMGWGSSLLSKKSYAYDASTEESWWGVYTPENVCLYKRGLWERVKKALASKVYLPPSTPPITLNNNNSTIEININKASGRGVYIPGGVHQKNDCGASCPVRQVMRSVAASRFWLRSYRRKARATGYEYHFSRQTWRAYYEMTVAQARVIRRRHETLVKSYPGGLAIPGTSGKLACRWLPGMEGSWQRKG